MVRFLIGILIGVLGKILYDRLRDRGVLERATSLLGEGRQLVAEVRREITAPCASTDLVPSGDPDATLVIEEPPSGRTEPAPEPGPAPKPPAQEPGARRQARQVPDSTTPQ